MSAALGHATLATIAIAYCHKPGNAGRTLYAGHDIITFNAICRPTDPATYTVSCPTYPRLTRRESMRKVSSYIHSAPRGH